MCCILSRWRLTEDTFEDTHSNSSSNNNDGSSNSSNNNTMKKTIAQQSNNDNQFANLVSKFLNNLDENNNVKFIKNNEIL